MENITSSYTDCQFAGCVLGAGCWVWTGSVSTVFSGLGLCWCTASRWQGSVDASVT